MRGNFRSDLYYRLHVLTIHIPSLRNRIDDLPLLVQHFLLRQSRTLGRSFNITPEAMALLCQYSWPGNVRELENMLERVTYLMPGTTITIADLPIDVQQAIENNQASSIRDFDTAIQTQKSLHELHKAQPELTEQGRALKEIWSD
jgi:DNA-binding NtrC family response regulator